MLEEAPTEPDALTTFTPAALEESEFTRLVSPVFSISSAVTPSTAYVTERGVARTPRAVTTTSSS